MNDKILIVDDSPSPLMLMKFTLEKEGFSVLEAENGDSAVGILNKNQEIKCLVTDINMPGINGIELVECVRKMNNHKFMPVIVLTSPDNPRNKKEARNVGATGWLDKPFKPETLVKVIKKTGTKQGV